MRADTSQLTIGLSVGQIRFFLVHPFPLLRIRPRFSHSIDPYNKRPAWLQNAHRKLDEAVFAAYGWPATLTDAELLERLLALNHERAAS